MQFLLQAFTILLVNNSKQVYLSLLHCNVWYFLSHYMSPLFLQKLERTINVTLAEIQACEIYDFLIRLSHFVTKHLHINKNLLSSRFLFIRQCFVNKWLSQIKKIINIHYQWSLPDPTPSATSLKINFQILDFDT